MTAQVEKAGHERNWEIGVDTYTFLMHACRRVLSHVQLFASPWTVARRAPLSMEFSMQEYWSAFSFLTPGDLPYRRIKPVSPALSGGFSATVLLGKPIYC